MDIVSRLPFALGRAVSGAAAASAAGAVDYDFAFNGMGFIAAWSDERPYQRTLVPIRKDQFDQAREPGEQSLSDWWLRSQADFFGGEGLTNQDPDQVSAANLQNRHTIQYEHSVGLNPWTRGQISLLRKPVARQSDAVTETQLLQGWDDDGVPHYWGTYGPRMYDDDGTTITNITQPDGSTISSLTSDGTNYYASTTTGIYKGTGTGASTLLWNTGGQTVAAWVKGRLMAGIGPSVYELVGGTPPTLPTPNFTHLNPDWTWTSFADGLSCIYVAGFAGSTSQIYKLVLDDSGSVPVLASGGITAAQLPQGEIVLSMYAYLGTYIGIGTNKGFRVGQIDSNGDIVYGPLNVLAPEGVQCIAAYDRFFYFGATNAIDGKSGLWRLDLGQPIYDDSTSASLRFAYATDLYAPVTGAVTGLTNFGSTDRMAFAVVGAGSFLEHATDLMDTGYFETGKIRYSTLEPKLYKFLTVQTPTTITGSLKASLVPSQGDPVDVYTVAEGSSLLITNISLSSALPRALEWVKVRLDFTASAASSNLGPVVYGYQLKALPGSTRQRQFLVPMMCFDREQDRHGTWDGFEGRTLDRLEAFEQLAQSGDSFTFSDLNLRRSWIVMVDTYQFEQKAAPANNANGYGGYLTVQLHTVADVVP